MGHDHTGVAILGLKVKVKSQGQRSKCSWWDTVYRLYTVLMIFGRIVCHAMRVMVWRVRPSSERNCYRCALKRVGLSGAINGATSSSSTTVCTEAWPTESRLKLTGDGRRVVDRVRDTQRQ